MRLLRCLQHEAQPIIPVGCQKAALFDSPLNSNVGRLTRKGALMSNSSHEITKAFWALGDYFSRLGGAARYFNMPESDIPLYIACQLAVKHSSSFEPKDYVADQFVEAASPVLEKVHSHLELVTAQDNELAGLICEFVNFANSKLKEHDRSTRWNRFTERSIRTYAQPIIPPGAAR